MQFLSDVMQKLSSAQDQLSAAKMNADSLKLRREELTCGLLKLTEELNEVKVRVKTLTAERDQCKEAHSFEAELGKLDAERRQLMWHIGISMTNIMLPIKSLRGLVITC